MYHKAVLLNEAVDALNICGGAGVRGGGQTKEHEDRSNGTYIDATLGGAGHTKKILEQLGPKGRLIVFDKDEDARANLPEDKRVTFIRNNFRFAQNYVELLSFVEGKRVTIDGVLADLGVSSHQFDTAERGFSYRYDTPLDMRMNRDAKTSAADIVNNSSKEELERVLADYGELSNARAIAGEIAKNQGNIKTTGDLCKALQKFYTQQSERKFLGKVFQALRIEVNGEMEALEDLLWGCKNILAKGGRAVFITYHSLEDRLVKNSFRDYCKEGEFSLVNKKPILPHRDEIEANARSRSAKLRIAEKN